MEDVMIGNMLRPIQANAVEAVFQQCGALTMFAVWTFMRLGIVTTYKHVTRSRLSNERVTAGRLAARSPKLLSGHFNAQA